MEQLTERERKILELMGMTDTRIAMSFMSRSKDLLPL